MEIDVIQAAATHDDLVDRAAAGEVVVLTIGGSPRARLVPAEEGTASS